MFPSYNKFEPKNEYSILTLINEQLRTKQKHIILAKLLGDWVLSKHVFLLVLRS